MIRLPTGVRRVVTAVVVADGELTAEDLIAYCRELVGYSASAGSGGRRAPARPMGKIRKHDLHASSLDPTPRFWRRLRTR